MTDLTKRTIQVGITFGAIVGLIGCQEGTEDVTLMQDNLESENGLAMNGLAMNGLAMNGLAMNGLAMNGLAMNGLAMNGLATVDGLSSTSGMMTTAGGRDIVKYMVKCALPAGQSITKKDQYDTEYTFPGSIGIAPEALNGTCDLDCQERISACLLAHVNNSGAHIGIWLNGPDAAVGWGSNPAFPYQEGAFFGNLIANPWQGYYCIGKNMGSGEVPGRLGAPIATNVYANAYGYEGKCANNCTTTNEGFTQCGHNLPALPYTAGHKWSHVVTVWRNFESSQMYKICTKSGPTRCLGVVGGSTAEGANIEHRTYSGSASQHWQIVQVETGKYKFVNVASGKALDVNGTSDGSQVVQRSYTGVASQKIPVVYFLDQPGYANLKPSSSTLSIAGSDTAEGLLMKLTPNNSPDHAKWGFTAIGAVSGTPVDPTGAAGSTGSTGTAGSTGAGGSTGGSTGAAGSAPPASLFTAGTGYRIGPQARNGGVSLDLSGGNMNNGSAIQFYGTATNNNNQRMQLIANGSNWKIVMTNNTNKCFDVGTANGSLLVINDCNGGAGQNWTVAYDGSSFQVKNAASNRCLDVPAGNTNNGSRPQIYDCAAGNTNQKWLIWASQ